MYYNSCFFLCDRWIFHGQETLAGARKILDKGTPSLEVVKKEYEIQFVEEVKSGDGDGITEQDEQFKKYMTLARIRFARANAVARILS